MLCCISNTLDRQLFSAGEIATSSRMKSWSWLLLPLGLGSFPYRRDGSRS